VDSHTSEIWQNILSIINTKLSKPSFDTWFKATKVVSIDDHSIVISAPTTFAVEWLESRYTKLVATTVYEYLGKQVDVSFVIEESAPPEQPPVYKEPQAPVQTEDSISHMLNPKYTFDTFVIGSGNRFAHAASLAVAEAPARAYNPLFLYGGVGLGKTHLMHAIGHYILEHSPSSKVV